MLRKLTIQNSKKILPYREASYAQCFLDNIISDSSFNPDVPELVVSLRARESVRLAKKSVLINEMLH
jgi:hypothetical protein